MKDPFFKFFELETNTLSQSLYGEDLEFKEYPDLPEILLPQEKKTSLYTLLEKRESTARYSGEAVSLEKITKIVASSVGLKDSNVKRRLYPSGGAKYPTEVYIAAINVEGLEPGTYHYGPKKHILTKISGIEKSKVFECFPLNTSNTAIFEASALIFLSFSKNRSFKKYGNLAYKLGLIEVGHVGQNFYLNATLEGVGVRAHAGGDFEAINDILNLDGIGETVIYTISLGCEL